MTKIHHNYDDDTRAASLGGGLEGSSGDRHPAQSARPQIQRGYRRARLGRGEPLLRL